MDLVTPLRAALDAFRRSHPARERSAEGVAWRYLLGGRGDHTLLLLPGYFVGAEPWFLVQERLERSFRVMAVEYAPVNTVAALGSGLSALLSAEGIATVHLVGQSIGALYAQELASRSEAFCPATRQGAPVLGRSHGESPRVQSLVLVNGSLPRTADLARVRRGVALGRLAPAFVHRRQWARRIAAERPDADGTSTFWRELFVERAGRLAKRDAIAWGACYASLLARGELRRADFEPLHGRVLIVESPDDPVIAAVERRALRAFHTGADVASLEGAGHLAPERRPDELAAAIEAFVRAR